MEVVGKMSFDCWKLWAYWVCVRFECCSSPFDEIQNLAHRRGFSGSSLNIQVYHDSDDISSWMRLYLETRLFDTDVEKTLQMWGNSETLDLLNSQSAHMKVREPARKFSSAVPPAVCSSMSFFFSGITEWARCVYSIMVKLLLGHCYNPSCLLSVLPSLILLDLFRTPWRRFSFRSCWMRLFCVRSLNGGNRGTK